MDAKNRPQRCRHNQLALLTCLSSSDFPLPRLSSGRSVGPLRVPDSRPASFTREKQRRRNAESFARLLWGVLLSSRLLCQTADTVLSVPRMGFYRAKILAIDGRAKDANSPGTSGRTVSSFTPKISAGFYTSFRFLLSRARRPSHPSLLPRHWRRPQLQSPRSIHGAFPLRRQEDR
jgi:hypothetical protein